MLATSSWTSARITKHWTLIGKKASYENRTDQELRKILQFRGLLYKMYTFFWSQDLPREWSLLHTFIFAKNVSMLERAVWKTSEGRSYQTLRQRSTWALPSLMPGDIPAPWPPAPGLLISCARRLSSWWRRGWTSITTCNKWVTNWLLLQRQ